MAVEVETLTAWLSRPLRWARLVVAGGIVLLVAGVSGAAYRVHVNLQVTDVAQLLQGIEAGVNDLVFIGVGLFFLLMIETRVKRARALKSLHTLRSLAHIIDLHQMKKDPERILGDSTDPTAPPAMSATELARYLDHCADMLTLISKLAALHVQEFNDSSTLAVVQEVEDLAHGLVRNIWQKIAIVDRVHVG